MSHIFKIDEKGINLLADARVSYRSGDARTIAAETNGEVALSREIKKEGNTYFVRLTAENKSGNTLFLETLTPLAISTLSLPVPEKEWNVFLDGRHKNDLPSVCCLGIDDDALSDAASGMTETGEYISRRREDGAMTLCSDRMLQIHTDEATVTFSFRSADNCFYRMEMEIGADKSFNGLQICCDWKAELAPGKTAKSEWVAIDMEKDALSAIDAFARSREQKKKKAPVLYSTWYYYGMDITPETIWENIEEIQEQNLPFDVFQLDDGWEACYGNWEPNLKFPGGMQEIAAWIHAAGMTAGIWTCPFTIHPNAPIVDEHSDWLLRKKDGEYCYFRANNRYCHILDMTHPGVIQYLEDLYHKLTFDWGFTYHKLDFTRCAFLEEEAAYYDSEKPPVLAYREAMQAVRRGIGEESFLLVCGGLYDALIGIADGQRTGSDVLSMWKNNGVLRLPFTVKQNTLRYYMNYWWHNDADSLMVRRNTTRRSENLLALGTLSDVEAQTFTANQYIGGGLVGMTERLSEIDEDRLSLLRHITPIVKTEVRPLSLYGQRFVSDVAVYVKEKEYYTICHINWSDEPETFSLEITERLAPLEGPYVAAEFFSGKVFEEVHRGETVTFDAVPPHGIAIVKIAAKKLPMIVGSTGHFSMGGEVADILENTDGSLLVKPYMPLPFPVTYKILTESGIITV